MRLARVITLAAFSAFMVGTSFAQQPAVPAAAAPVPEQILNARKVFIANAPGDLVSYPKNEVTRPYNEFYAAMKGWGRFQLVTSPAEADLVLEIKITDQPVINIKTGSEYRQPEFALTFVDPKTGVPLWWLAEIIQGANRPATLEKNYTAALTSVVNDLKKLVQ